MTDVSGAVERLTEASQGIGQFTLGRNVFVSIEDLRAILSALSASEKREQGLVEALERIVNPNMGGGFLGAMFCREVATKALQALKAGGE